MHTIFSRPVFVAVSIRNIVGPYITLFGSLSGSIRILIRCQIWPIWYFILALRNIFGAQISPSGFLSHSIRMLIRSNKFGLSGILSGSMRNIFRAHIALPGFLWLFI